MAIRVPEPCVVVLVGPAGSGKTTFARAHFRAEEVFSSDAWGHAFPQLHAAAQERVGAGGIAVIDATNLDLDARGRALDLAAAGPCDAICVALDVPLADCLAGNAARPDRHVDPGVVRRQHAAFRRALPSLMREGFDALHVLRGRTGVSSTAVERVVAAAEPDT